MSVGNWWRKRRRRIECHRKYGKGKCPHLERHAKSWISYSGTSTSRRSGGSQVRAVAESSRVPSQAPSPAPELADDQSAASATVVLGKVFGNHLAAQGWEVLHREDADFVLAMHGTETLAAELGAQTDQPGEEMDRLYGRLLRRLPDYPDAHVVGVVPERMRWHVDRVPDSIRRALHLDIYLVDDFGSVRRLRPDPAEGGADAQGLARLSAAIESVAPELSSTPRARRAGSAE